MHHLGTLPPRHFDVLHAIVQTYIETGEPVASRAIAHKYPMSAASIRNTMADLLEADYLSQDELTSIRNYINYNFGGWMMQNIHRELKRRLELESAAYDAILKRVNLIYSKGLLDLGLMPEVHFEGAENLIGLDLHLTRERMRDLFRALEEKKRILQLLERFLEQRDGELAIQVGLAEAHPSMSELSLIGVRFAMPNGLEAN